MLLIGVEYTRELSDRGGFSAKAVFNENGAVFFPVSREHRDQSAAGISYRDNYEGNALAAMLAPGKLEIRFHRDFDDRRVATIVAALVDRDELSFLRSWSVTYQGRPIG